MTLLRRLERHMRREGLCPSALGRMAVNDPRLIFDLRRGRELRPATEARLQAWLDARETPARAGQIRGPRAVR